MSVLRTDVQFRLVQITREEWLENRDSHPNHWNDPCATWNGRECETCSGACGCHWRKIAMTGNQEIVRNWVVRVFSEDVCKDTVERGFRCLEEVIELAQALMISKEQAHALVDYVYSRPAGEPGQELAGVLATLYATAAALNVSLDEVFATEVQRIHTPEIIRKVQRRQVEKREIGHSTISDASKEFTETALPGAACHQDLIDSIDGVKHWCNRRKGHEGPCAWDPANVVG